MFKIIHFILFVILASTIVNAQDESLKALIIDGENNHGIWPKTTMMIKDYLEQTDLFEVDIYRTVYTWQGPHHDVEGSDITALLEQYPLANHKSEPVKEPKVDPNFAPDFGNYDLVVSNFGWKASPWQEAVKKGLEDYVNNGGGFIVIHAGNNSWGHWHAYNKMIAVGGWGGRADDYGSYIYYDTNNEFINDTNAGSCGSHGAQHEFILTTRAPEHPIMKDLPAEWLHAKDELYERLRGPAENVTILATAFSDASADEKRTNRNEPMLMAIEYGQGRVFHTALGHMDYSMECVGFITTLQRGAEWAATGKVTQEIPEDFPNKKATSIRNWNK